MFIITRISEDAPVTLDGRTVSFRAHIKRGRNPVATCMVEVAAPSSLSMKDLCRTLLQIEAYAVRPENCSPRPKGGIRVSAHDLVIRS